MKVVKTCLPGGNRESRISPLPGMDVDLAKGFLGKAILLFDFASILVPGVTRTLMQGCRLPYNHDVGGDW